MDRLTIALCLALLAACSTPPKAHVDAGDAPKPRESASTVEIRADLDEAKRQLAIAEMSAAHGAIAAEAELDEAQRRLVKAEAELAASGQKTQIELDDARLDIQRAEFRLEEARAELAELEAMYEEEEFAKTTKELVLTRGRRQLELSEQGLALSRLRFEARQAEARIERMGKEDSVRQARFEVAKAEHGLQKSRMQVELELLQARRKVEELEKKLAERESRS